MKKLSDAKKSILGNMIIRQTMGGIKKEDRIKDKDELIERINKECEKQDSRTTGKVDLTMLDVSLVEDMCFVFVYYEFLESIDVSNWDVSNVTDMEGMFYGCNSLKSVDVSNWNVSNVKDMQYMFYMCNSLEPVDVSKWDVNNLKDMHSMFKGCKFNYRKEGNRLIEV